MYMVCAMRIEWNNLNRNIVIVVSALFILIVSLYVSRFLYLRVNLINESWAFERWAKSLEYTNTRRKKNHIFLGNHIIADQCTRSKSIRKGNWNWNSRGQGYWKSFYNLVSVFGSGVISDSAKEARPSRVWPFIFVSNNF